MSKKPVNKSKSNSIAKSKKSASKPKEVKKVNKTIKKVDTPKAVEKKGAKKTDKAS